MSKNKMDLIVRLANKIEVQGERLKRLMDKFYPDGVRAEFAEAPQIGKTMMDSPAARRFSEDEQTLLKCLKITEDVRKIGSESIEIDFYCTSLTFKNIYCVDYSACIMFKINPEDVSVYVHEGFGMEGIMLRFLIDSERKEAFLLLEDFECRDSGVEINRSSSFIPLSEFHAILSRGYDYKSNTMKGVEFMVSFSQEEGKCCVEEIYKSNWPLLEKLFPSNESKKEADEPATCMDSQSETTTEIPEQLSSGSDDSESPPIVQNSNDVDDLLNSNNDVPPPKKRGRPAKKKPNVKVEVETETVTPSEPIPKASEMFELA